MFNLVPEYVRGFIIYGGITLFYSQMCDYYDFLFFLRWYTLIFTAYMAVYEFLEHRLNFNLFLDFLELCHQTSRITFMFCLFKRKLQICTDLTELLFPGCLLLSVRSLVLLLWYFTGQKYFKTLWNQTWFLSLFIGFLII